MNNDACDPIGANDVGKIGIRGVVAAVANAVYDVTGGRVRSLTITADLLL